jgi:cobalt/nickel transport system permease protein
MSSLYDSIYEIGRIDTFALQDTPVHRIDPRAKVVTTMVFLVCVVSFPRYTIVPMIPFVLYPVVMASEGRIPYSWLGSRLLAAAPFAVIVGMFNPLLDREMVSLFGGPGIAAGWISFASIVLRFLLTTAAALTLVGTTGMNGVCAALDRLKVPDVFVTQLLFLYRYIFVLAEESARTIRARDLRSFGKRGTGITVFGQILGHLLLRTYARARRIYSAMLLRGFDGHVRTRRPLNFTMRDTIFMLAWSAAFVAFRYFNVPETLGTMITGVLP